MSLFGSLFGGRWHPPMSTDVSKLEDFGDEESAFGDEEGDYPPAPTSTNIIGTSWWGEVIDIDRQEDIKIIDRKRADDEDSQYY